MEIGVFGFNSPNRLLFGAGSIRQLPKLAHLFGETMLLVLGSTSFEKSGQLDSLKNELQQAGITFFICHIFGEPSPEVVDSICEEYRGKDIQLITAIGGGSVLDGGKAVAAMLSTEGSVTDYLEGVGTKTHSGESLPFIAVPTTSGTGSEATKNAVISRVGKDGFKKSLRHDNFIPDIALVDPELTISCPSHVTAACGLDAFTQLLEAYVSTKASPMTDALAYSGLSNIIPNLEKATREGAGDIQVRSAVSYASYLSGLCLANAGLGVVHGFASSIGGLFDIPHGVVCGTLLGTCTSSTIKALREEGGTAGLKKYAAAGRLFQKDIQLNDKEACDLLILSVSQWIDRLHIPSLGKYGVKAEDTSFIAQVTANKNNPVSLSEEVLTEIILERL